MNSPSDPVWLVTGASSGLGYALASRLLQHGHRVVLGARTLAPMQELARAFPETAFVVSVDVTDSAEISRAVATAQNHFGSVDVLVNNAGVGYLAAIEEGEDEDIRWQFETNFFGAATMIRAVLPGMRARGFGTIVNVSSVAGFVGVAGMGYYNASKFALEGLSEALRREVEPLGIKVMLVEPGGLRTGMAQRNRVGRELPAYAKTAGAFRNFVGSGGGSVNLGDPIRAASVIHRMVEATRPPRRLALGTDAYSAITAKIDVLRAEYRAHEQLSRSTDFPSVAQFSAV